MDGPDPRALSFGAVASIYDRARPGYPAEAIALALGAAPLDVADLGAGTGKLTRALLAAGHRVTAIDPDPAMLAQLGVALPAVPRLVGSAEAIPLPDASVDAVIAGQAFHWFTPSVALPEIARVLRPGGTLALLWNNRDGREPWVGELDVLLDAVQQERRDLRREQALAGHPLFGPVTEHEVCWADPIDRATLLDAVRSRSYIVLLPDAERAAVLAAVSRVWEAYGLDDATALLPYRTQVFSARLR
jgi:SAM-dependent methyltransferase